MDERIVYEVPFDGAANRRAMIVYVRQSWPLWRSGLLTYAAMTAAGLVVFYHVARSFEAEFGIAGASIAIAVLGILFVICFYWTMYQKAFDRAAIGEDGKNRWVCEFTENCYVFTDENGYQQALPWKLMTIRHEGPDAFTIKHGKAEILVFRKPLQDAGLEDEFRRRVSEAV